jgi:IclR family pca regulon transcriptional regulator
MCSFTADSRVQTVSQVASATGLDRAGARRMLRTLETLGYVRREGPKFQLTPRVLDLAYVYLSTTPLKSVAEPVIKKLAGIVNESCSASVLDGTEIVYMVTVPAHRIMAINLSVGSRLPAYCTSQGRVLLGGLSKSELNGVLKQSNIKKQTKYTVTSILELERIIRRDQERGWSLLNQELEEGICSISVPIVERSGRMIAAMSIAGSLSRTTPKKMISMVLPELKQAAREVHSLLLGSAFPSADRLCSPDPASKVSDLLAGSMSGVKSLAAV